MPTEIQGKVTAVYDAYSCEVEDIDSGKRRNCTHNGAVTFVEGDLVTYLIVLTGPPNNKDEKIIEIRKGQS
jgi:hypothetical protein